MEVGKDRGLKGGEKSSRIGRRGVWNETRRCVLCVCCVEVKEGAAYEET